MHRLAATLTLSAILLGVPRVACAEEPSADSSYLSAERAFTENRIDEACQLLRKSYESEPRLRTLHRLGWYEESAGRLATAATVYDTYLGRYERLDEYAKSLERSEGRLDFVRQHRDAVDSKIPSVTLILEDRVPGARVLRKSQETGQLTSLALGVPLPIDPGWHVVTLQVPFREDRLVRFYIRVGERLNLELDLPEVKGAYAFKPHQPVAPVPNILPPMDPGPSGQRIAAWITGAAGVGGIVTGLVLGGVAWGEKPTIRRECPRGYCTTLGIEAKDSARTYGWWSTGSLVTGAVLLTTGILLYVLEPERTRTLSADRRRPLQFPATDGGLQSFGSLSW